MFSVVYLNEQKVSTHTEAWFCVSSPSGKYFHCLLSAILIFVDKILKMLWVKIMQIVTIWKVVNDFTAMRLGTSLQLVLLWNGNLAERLNLQRIWAYSWQSYAFTRMCIFIDCYFCIRTVNFQWNGVIWWVEVWSQIWSHCFWFSLFSS